MKPNILLLPGLLNDASVFTNQVAALSAMSTVEVGDLTVAETIPDLAASVLKLASAKHFVLLGLSLGGYVAFEIMRQAPERVTGLVLMDTTARPDTPEASAKREALIKLAATDLGRDRTTAAAAPASGSHEPACGAWRHPVDGEQSGQG